MQETDGAAAKNYSGAASQAIEHGQGRGAMTIRNISVLMNDRPGVLARVSELFASIGCNIERLKVAEGWAPGVSRMKLVAVIEDERLEWLLKRIVELNDVIQVKMGKAHTGTAAYWIVAYSLFVTILGINVASPLYSLYREQWSLQPGTITLVFAVYALTVIPSIMAFGQLSGRVGPKKVLLGGTAAALLGSICMALATGLPMLLLARVLQGLSVGMLNGVAVAAMTALHRDNAGNKAAFAAALAVTAGNALGPVISGFLAEFAPYPTKVPYLMHTLLTLPGLLGLLLIRMRVAGNRSLRLHLPVIQPGIRAIFYTAAGASFIAWGVISMFMSVIPSSMGEWIGKPSFIVAGVMVALALVISTISQMSTKSYSPKYTVTISYLLVATGLGTIVASVMHQSVALLLLSACLVGMGHGPLYAVSLAAVNQAASDKSRADTVSLYYVITYLGVALPVLGLGFTEQYIGLTAAVAIFSAVMTVLIVIGLWSWRQLFKK